MVSGGAQMKRYGCVMSEGVFLSGSEMLMWQAVRPVSFCGLSHHTPYSKRQLMLFQSSAETEYRGVANAVAETCWLQNLLCELHTPSSSTTLVYCDNFIDVYLSSNPVQCHTPKISQRKGNRRRDVHSTQAQGLPTALFGEFRTSLSVRSPPAQTVGEC
ncbi:ribonuclease H-like domain-containing protein [Tanacetum coccineum]